MRYMSAMLLLILFSTPVFSDEQADIQAVEKELRLEKQADEILRRARNRARNAVKKSSIGRELERRRAADKEAMITSRDYLLSQARFDFEDILRKANRIFSRIMSKFVDDEIKKLRQEKSTALLHKLQELMKVKKKAQII